MLIKFLFTTNSDSPLTLAICSADQPSLCFLFTSTPASTNLKSYVIINNIYTTNNKFNILYYLLYIALKANKRVFAINIDRELLTLLLQNIIKNTISIDKIGWMKY